MLKINPTSHSTQCVNDFSCPSNSKKNSINRISIPIVFQNLVNSQALEQDWYNTYTKKIDNSKEIIPLKEHAFPNIPGATNILSIPSEIYSSTNSLIASIKNRDHEGIQDALSFLIATPINLASSTGILLNYCMKFHWLSHSLSVLILPTYISGLILCLIEGIVDSFGLARQIKFNQKFDFNWLKHLKILTDNEKMMNKSHSLNATLSLIQKNLTLLETSYGKEKVKDFLNFFTDLKEECDARPYYQNIILDKHQNKIKEFARLILEKNILHFQEKYLRLNSEEIKQIKRAEKDEEKRKQLLDQHLNKKYKMLARRVRPWMVHEATEKVPSILKALSSPKYKDLALKEGLSLMHEMQIQNDKKTGIHIMGIICLLIASISLIALFIGAPYAVALILGIIASVVGTGRFLAFSGSLDVRGFNFSFKNILPDWLRRKIWSQPSLNDPENLQRRIITPLTEIYDSPNSSVLR